MSYDECPECRRKDGELEYMQCQLDSVRKLIEDERNESTNCGITALYHRRSDLLDEIYEELEK